MFGCLKPWSEKDTEAARLKQEISQCVDDLKAKAKQGDSDASLRLKALEETITEQSIRLVGGNRQ